MRPEPAELRVRHAGSGDLERVLAVHAAHAPGRREPGPPTPAERATWERMVATADLTVYLTELGDEPVGTATMLTMPNLNYPGPTAFIEAVVVVPVHRRRGIATALLRSMLDDAGRLGCDKVQLLSHKRHAHDGAHALYEKVGFTAEAEGFRRYLRSDGPPR
jgi:GNAT superfamily N-acetyltransferase